LVVSTKVGGIPEVLPSNDTQTDIMILCEANINGKLIFILLQRKKNKRNIYFKLMKMVFGQVLGRKV